MARKAVEIKKVGETTYYTSTHFAKTVYVNKREARAFLEDFQSIEGHTNPRLYDKKTMEKAINAYKQGKRTRDVYEKKKLERLRMKEVNRVGKEEDIYFEFLESLDSSEKEVSEEEYYARIYAHNKYKQELPIMMLRHLLYLQGYNFNEMLYLKDLILHEISEIYREDGEKRRIEHIEAIERLESNDGYLEEI